jgi:outer membrane receptor protein involved in Fe transport
LSTRGGLAQTATTPSRTTDETKPPAPVQLSVFEVSTSQDRGYQSADSVSATRIDTPLVNIPSSVIVFNEQFLNDINATELKDVLIYDPSVNPTSSKDDTNIRGFGGNNNVGKNGFGQIQQGNMVANMSTSSRVEFLKGPAAILFGDGAFGGTVNRIDKPTLTTPYAASRFLATWGGQSGPDYRMEIDLGGPLRGVAFAPELPNSAFSYRLDLVLQRGTGWGDLLRNETAIAPKLTWQLGGNTTVTVGYTYDDQETQGNWQYTIHGGNPHGIVLGDGSFRPYDLNLRFWQPGEFRRNRNNLVDVDVRQRLGKNWNFRSQVQVEHNDQEVYETLIDNTTLTILRDTALMATNYRILPDSTTRYATRNEFVGTFDTGPVKHRALVGASWYQLYDFLRQWRSPSNYGGINNAQTYNYLPTVTRAQFYADPAAYGFNPAYTLPVDMWDPRGTEEHLAAGGPYRVPLYIATWSQQKIEKTDIYFSDLASLFNERLFLQFGGRQNNVHSYSLNGITGSFPTTSRFNPAARKTWTLGHAFTHSEGLVYHIKADKTLTAYANFNTGFSPNTTIDPDGTTFAPQEARQKEVGIKTSLLDGRINAIIDAYDTLQTNVVANDTSRAGGYHILIDGLRSQGLELNVNGFLTRNWQIFGGYAYTDARNELTQVAQFQQPKHGMSLFNRYEFSEGAAKGLSFSFGSIYRSTAAAQPAAVAGRPEPAWTIPSYWRFDAGLGWRRKIGKIEYSASIFARNVADNREIYWNATYVRFTPAPGREWTLSMNAKF